MQVYLVGGAVRDKLLGLEVADRDHVVVGATPDDLLAQGYRPVGKDFPVFLHPDSAEEYALARTERKTGRGYHGFAFQADPSVTLEQDLERAGLWLRGSHHAHALHSPYWWIRCAGGVNQPDRPVAKRYHDFLVWQLTKNPKWLATVDRVLNPLMGKSLVIYTQKVDR